MSKIAQRMIVIMLPVLTAAKAWEAVFAFTVTHMATLTNS
jgi:hypothetical protein